MLAFAIKSAIVLALLYWVFFALLSKETLHRLNRITLVLSMVISLVLPLFPHTIELSFLKEKAEAEISVGELQTMEILSEEDVQENAFITFFKELTWLDAVTYIYYAGMVVMLLFLIVQILSLYRYIRGGLRHTDANGNIVILKSGKVPSFSVFRHIVMSVEDYEQNKDSILLHEQSHIALGHTYDLLLLEATKIVQWFNPFVWLLGRDLKSIHEYEADMSVLNHGVDATQYQQLLVCKAAGPAAYAMINGFNQSQLITRIIMMNKKQSSPKSWARYIALLPMLAIAFVVTANVKKAPAEITEILISQNDSITIIGDNSPLILVDGVKIAALNTVDKDNIERIDVFKGDSKEAKEYSEKYPEAINGVVMITMRKGEAKAKANANDENNQIFTVVEEQPTFPGGAEALVNFIKENLRYPAACVKDSIEGRVTLSFIVEKDGTISTIEPMRSPNEDLTAEAIRVVAAMPKWIPGKQRGQAVRVKYVIPITFKLKNKQ